MLQYVTKAVLWRRQNRGIFTHFAGCPGFAGQVGCRRSACGVGGGARPCTWVKSVLKAFGRLH
jgi:hypothetical protein